MDEPEITSDLTVLHADMCAALASPLRVQLIYLLAERAQSVKELVEASGGGQSTISRHL